MKSSSYLDAVLLWKKGIEDKITKTVSVGHTQDSVAYLPVSPHTGDSVMIGH